MDIGTEIGADIPYCIVGGTALCEGIGEIIKPLESFKDKILILVKPPFGVSTREVYQRLDINKIKLHPPTEALMNAMKKQDLRFVAGNMKNVLENVTVNKFPVIRRIKNDMIKLGAAGSMMSGSGPTVFGFFDDMLKAQRCYDYMKLKYKDTFITRTI
jgi:4-diphosphocytidyl-2-C-methyl-D-erythritol kinase